MTLHAIGFGSLNLDEFWEVSGRFLSQLELQPGEEYVRDVAWFRTVYPTLEAEGILKGVDPGGSAANMIAALFKMGFATGFYGATGSDGEEHLALGSLGKPEDLRIRKVGLPAGRCLALIDRDDTKRDRTLVVLPNSNDLAGSEEPDVDYFQQAQWVHLTSFVSLEPLEVQARLVDRLDDSTRVSFDPGAVYVAKGLHSLLPVLRRTDLLFITREELASLTSYSGIEAGVTFLFEIGVKTVIVKLGPEGMMACEPERSVYQPAVVPREIKDRTGAGDVAAAGFLAGMIKSLGLEASLQLAARAASKSLEDYGRRSYPDKDFLDNAISSL